MAKLRCATAGAMTLAPAGERLVAESMYQKGKSFLGAAFLLHEKPGHEYVTLHLLGHGIENILKGLLLLKNYDKYMPKLKLKPLGHNLEGLATAARHEFALRKPNPKLEKELGHFSRRYSNHLLRYGTFRDILVDATTIQSDRVWRSMLAVLRLSERHLRQSRP